MSTSKNNKHLIVIVGPTAIGKTALSIFLAKHFKCEVLSADSRQFYKEMEIGTAKPTPKEMDGVPHHFVNNLSIQDHYTAGKFESEALDVLEQLYQKDDLAILVGGSGLFVDALCFGLDEIPSDPEIRTQLNEELALNGLKSLQDELLTLDPEFYETADVQNPVRVIRALEVIRKSGQKFSSFRKKKKKQRPFHIHFIGLNTEREILYNRINLRVDLMVQNGLIEEVKSLLNHKDTTPLKTVGYQELFPHLSNPKELEKAIEQVKQNTRRFAKRQLTWFKRNDTTKWFEPQQNESVLAYLNDQITNSK